MHGIGITHYARDETKLGKSMSYKEQELLCVVATHVSRSWQMVSSPAAQFYVVLSVIRLVLPASRRYVGPNTSITACSWTHGLADQHW